MLRKKYKKGNSELVKDIIKAGTETCVLRIQLKAVSKVEGYFIYEVCYLDQGVVKTIPVIAKDVTEILKTVEPYINKGISEQQASFDIGGNDKVFISRRKNNDKGLA